MLSLEGVLLVFFDTLQDIRMLPIDNNNRANNPVLD